MNHHYLEILEELSDHPQLTDEKIRRELERRGTPREIVEEFLATVRAFRARPAHA